MTNRNSWRIAGIAASVVTAGIAAWLLLRGGRGSLVGLVPCATEPAGVAEPDRVIESERGRSEGIAGAVRSAPAALQIGAAETAEDNASKTEEDQKAEEEAKIEAFDALTDKWMEPARGDVSVDDVEMFAKTFRRIPKNRRDECIHRALNLIPDENVMLLVGILMDKSMDEEIVATVFNDILNRDESVKKPILLQVFKDKAHPCWADTTWILDATGETPTPSGK